MQHLHEKITTFTFYYWILFLILWLPVAFIFGATESVRYYAIPNIFVFMFLVLVIGCSRFRDKRYATLFRKYPKYYSIKNGKTN